MDINSRLQLPQDVKRRASARRRARNFARYTLALERHFEGLISQASLNQYRSKLRQLHEFCTTFGHHFPITSHSVLLAYLESKSHLRPSSIANHMQCLSSVYQVLGWEFPKSREIDHWIQRHRRSRGVRQRQAVALEGTLLDTLLSYQTAQFSHQQTQIMIRVGFDTLLRADNLGKIKIEHLDLDSDVVGKIFVPYSKSDQERKGRFVALSPSTSQALRDWLTKHALTKGCLFTRSEFGVDDSGVDNRFITKSLRSLAKAAGLSQVICQGLSSHSFRVGGAVDALHSGMTLEQLMIVGDWSSVRTVENYVRNADPLRIMAKRSHFH